MRNVVPVLSCVCRAVNVMTGTTTRVARGAAVLALALLGCRRPSPAPSTAGEVSPPAASAPAPAIASAPPSASAPSPSSARVESGPIPLPEGAPGIGFDDLRYSAILGKILVPAGRTGALDLVDTRTADVSPIGGFSAAARYEGGHDFGVTSVDQGPVWLYATDRTSGRLAVVDPAKPSIVASTRLAASPDYVRWVAPTSEIWVTEPDAEQIEIFAAGSPAPHQVALVKVKGGPESLQIDATRGRAYTHLWSGATVAIDLRSRAIVATWPNGCEGSRGIALDEPRGWLFVGCSEGAGVVLDAAHDGKQLSRIAVGAGVDIIDYAPALAQLYLPGAKSATMAIVGVSASGRLSLLETVPTARGGHCVTVDGLGNAYVCDPDRGRLLKLHDAHPPSR